MGDALSQLNVEKDCYGRYYIANTDGTLFHGYYKTERGARIALAKLKKGKESREEIASKYCNDCYGVACHGAIFY